MRRLLLSLVVFAFILTFWAKRADAQADANSLPAVSSSTLILQGTVLGPDDKPLANARVDVRLQGAQDDVTFGDTLTDEEGRFALLGLALKPEDYLVHASAPNMRADEQPFAIDKAGHASGANFTLKLRTPLTTRGATQEGYTLVRVYYATDRAPETGGPILNMQGSEPPTTRFPTASARSAFRRTIALLKWRSLLRDPA